MICGSGRPLFLGKSREWRASGPFADSIILVERGAKRVVCLIVRRAEPCV